MPRTGTGTGTSTGTSKSTTTTTSRTRARAPARVRTLSRTSESRSSGSLAPTAQALTLHSRGASRGWRPHRRFCIHTRPRPYSHRIRLAPDCSSTVTARLRLRLCARSQDDAGVYARAAEQQRRSRARRFRSTGCAGGRDGMGRRGEGEGRRRWDESDNERDHR